VATTLKREPGVTLWRQIEQRLLKDVEEELLTPGSRLPSEAELAIRFGVNRHTVRRAIAALEEKGVFLVQQGRGTFVHEHVIEYALSRRTRFTENLARQHLETKGQVLEAVTEAPDAATARALGLRAHQPVIRVELLRMSGGRPVSLARHTFSARRCAGIAEKIRALGSVTLALRALGIDDYLRKSTRILARMPEPQEALLLRQPRNRPILVTESVNVDATGMPLEFGTARFAGDRVQLMVQLP
jgi:GntR family transcriptional regulator, phosphonate transport system regulatory protein